MSFVILWQTIEKEVVREQRAAKHIKNLGKGEEPQGVGGEL